MFGLYERSEVQSSDDILLMHRSSDHQSGAVSGTHDFFYVNECVEVDTLFAILTPTEHENALRGWPRLAFIQTIFGMCVNQKCNHD